MTNFITSSALTRLLANIFVFLVLVSAMIIAIVEIFNNQAINPLVYGILASGLMYGSVILGVHTGVVAGGVIPATPEQAKIQSGPTLDQVRRDAFASMQTANVEAVRLDPPSDTTLQPPPRPFLPSK